MSDDDDISNKDMDRAEEAVRRQEAQVRENLNTRGAARARVTCDRFEEQYFSQQKRHFKVVGAGAQVYARLENPKDLTYSDQDAFVTADLELAGDRFQPARRIKLVLSENYDVQVDLS